MINTLLSGNNRDWFTGLFEDSADAILIVENDKFIHCNKATLQMFKTDDKSAILNTLITKLSPEYQPDNTSSADKAQKMLDIAFETGSNRFEWCHKKANDELFDVEVLLTRIHQDNKKLLHCVWRDITKIKEAEKALKSSEESYKFIFDQAADGLLIGNPKGIIINTNLSISKITGYSVDDLIGKSISVLFPNDVLQQKPLRYDLLEAGHSVLTERKLQKKDGSIIIIEMNSTKMTNNNLHAYIRNITERKNTEQKIIDNNRNLHIAKAELSKTNAKLIATNNQLKQQQEELKKAKARAEESDRLKSAFLANMSHEIRTPMNGILGFTQLLAIPDLSNDDQKQYLKIIDESGKRMLDILNNLIDISKIEAGQMTAHYENTNINKVLEGLFNFFFIEAKNKNINLICNSLCDNKTKIINTDKGKLSQVITNIIKNAIKFTKNGEIELGCKVENEFLKFYVKDNGIGINKDAADMIFHRFRQADNGKTELNDGAGLGLSISKAFIEMLGGEIWVESEINKGSTFFFTLPNK